MASRVTIDLYPQSQIIKELTHGGPVGDYLKFVAGRSKRHAIRLAQERTETGSGDYASSFDVKIVNNAKTGVAMLLTNSNEYAKFLELGVQPAEPTGYKQPSGRMIMVPAPSSDAAGFFVDGKLMVIRMTQKPGRGFREHPGISARHIMMDAVEAALHDKYTPKK